MQTDLLRRGGIQVLLLRAITLGVMLFVGCKVVLSAAFAHDQPPVAYVKVVARNPVEGLRELASREDGSYQVFLWRASHYLDDQFRGVSFESARKTLEEAGAVKIAGGRISEDGLPLTERYAVIEGILSSRVGRTNTCTVDVVRYPVVSVVPAILVTFGQPFSTVAARRDFAKGTVLDRVFGLVELERCAQETSQLDSIEVSCGSIGYVSSAPLGWGFVLKVEMSDPTGRSRMKDQGICCWACSNLEPRGPEADVQAKVHVARDSLRQTPVSFLHERSHPDTFGSFGASMTPRTPPAH